LEEGVKPLEKVEGGWVVLNEKVKKQEEPNQKDETTEQPAAQEP